MSYFSDSVIIYIGMDVEVIYMFKISGVYIYQKIKMVDNFVENLIRVLLVVIVIFFIGEIVVQIFFVYKMVLIKIDIYCIEVWYVD